MKLGSKNKIDLEKLQSRIVRLEELLTHQAVLLEELSAQLLAESKSHAALEKRQKTLLARMVTLEEQQEIFSQQDRPPPHY